MSELDDVFDTLEPPRGGLAGLREKIEEDRRSRSRRRFAGASAVVVAAAVALVVVLGHRSAPEPGAMLADRWSRSSDPAFIELGLIDATPDGVHVAPGAASSTAIRRVSSDSDEILYYRIASLEPAMAPPAESGDGPER